MQSMNIVLSPEQELDEAQRHLSIVRMILMKYITLIDRIKEYAKSCQEAGYDGIGCEDIEDIIRDHFSERKSEVPHED